MVSLVVLGVSFRLVIISDDNDGAFMIMSRCLTIFSFQAIMLLLSSTCRICPSRVNQLVASCSLFASLIQHEQNLMHRRNHWRLCSATRQSTLFSSSLHHCWL